MAQASLKTDAIALLNAKAARLDREGHIGNADNYKASAHSFERFINSLTPDQRKQLLGMSKQPTPTLLLSDITPGFLSQYERWMQLYGKAPASPADQPPRPG